MKQREELSCATKVPHAQETSRFAFADWLTMETEKIRCANPLAGVETQALTQYWLRSHLSRVYRSPRFGGSRGME
jgi:hypothetical protein